jgi:hypothetical protein
MCDQLDDRGLNLYTVAEIAPEFRVIRGAIHRDLDQQAEAGIR